MKNAIGITVLLTAGLVAFAQESSEDGCARTSHMKIYSNATYVEAAGDVVGIELALAPPSDDSVRAFLYDYEGAPTTDGVQLPGHVTGKTLAINGTWLQHSRDSDGGELVRSVPVEVRGTLHEREFAGTI